MLYLQMEGMSYSILPAPCIGWWETFSRNVPTPGCVVCSWFGSRISGIPCPRGCARLGRMDDDSRPVAVLVRTDGAPKTVPPLIAFSHPNSSVSVGRAENNQIPLNDKKISKNHAMLTLRACKLKGAQDGEVMRRVFIKDSSTFGTFVNGKPLKKGEWSILQEGDAIGLRNPHGNPSNGEYRVAYQDAMALVKGALERGEVPVKAVQASEPVASKSKLLPKEFQPAPRAQPTRVKTELPDEAMEGSKLPPVGASAVKAEPDEAGSPLSEVSGEPKEPKQPKPSAPLAPTKAEPQEEFMSPLSEVSEVSAPDDDEKPEANAVPGAMPGIPGMPAPLMMMPGMGLVPGMPFGLPGLVPGAPGFRLAPPGFQPSAPSGPVPNAALPGSKTAQDAKATSMAVAAKPVVMTIAAEFVGMLIGRGGEVVKQLSTEACSLNVILECTRPFRGFFFYFDIFVLKLGGGWWQRG